MVFTESKSGAKQNLEIFMNLELCQSLFSANTRLKLWIKNKLKDDFQSWRTFKNHLKEFNS